MQERTQFPAFAGAVDSVGRLSRVYHFPAWSERRYGPVPRRIARL